MFPAAFICTPILGLLHILASSFISLFRIILAAPLAFCVCMCVCVWTVQMCWDVISGVWEGGRVQWEVDGTVVCIYIYIRMRENVSDGLHLPATTLVSFRHSVHPTKKLKSISFANAAPLHALHAARTLSLLPLLP